MTLRRITLANDSGRISREIVAVITIPIVTSVTRAIANQGQTTVLIEGVEIDLLARRVRREGQDVHLTPKEYAVLAELAKHPGRVLTHSHLLRTVWGPAHEGDVEYLRVVARELRKKIEADPSSPQILKTEPAVGYRLADPKT